MAGPLCDRFGSRVVFSGILLLGAIPVGLAPLIHDATGLYIIRFFIGILGGSFVPCQVWSTGFFDKNVVGTANALTGGWGNAGGGITYFVMPAIYDSFVHRMGKSPGVAWRLSFIVPVVVLIVTGVSMLLLCPDTPMGKWSERHLHVRENLQSHGVSAAGNVVDVPGAITDKAANSSDGTLEKGLSDPDKKNDGSASDGEVTAFEGEHAISRTEMIETAKGETIVNPTLKESLEILVSPQTIFHIVTYFCSFGGELAVNSFLGAYYLKNFKYLGQTGASNWAAMFGFLNFVTRPLGGVVGDLLYRYGNRNLWLKKAWITVCGVMTGLLLIIIGRLDPHHEATMFGLVFFMAIFHEAGNGANFALIPHVHPFANGILSGYTGAGGNLGGVCFAIIYRFMDSGTNYAKAFWVFGIMHIGMNLSVAWIKPLPKGQIGGH